MTKLKIPFVTGLFIFTVVTETSCVTKRYSYRSETSPTDRSSDAQFPGAIYAVDDNGHDSAIQVRFWNFVKREDRKQNAVILRLFFDNKDHEKWYFRTKKQQIQLYIDHQEIIAPLFEIADADKVIQSGPTQFLDLAFPLPESVKNEADLKDFEFFGEVELPLAKKPLYVHFTRVQVNPDVGGNSWSWEEHHKKILNSNPSMDPKNPNPQPFEVGTPDNLDSGL